MKRKTVAVVILIVCILSFSLDSFAHNDDKHYKEIESVLFGNKAASILGNTEKKKLIRHLEYATGLALDQFNGSDGTLLIDLQIFGIPNLPTHITDEIDAGGFNFRESANAHRQYTHMGWTYEYDKNHRKANWPLRKQIMVETVKKVLFKKDNSYDDTYYDSFAAVLYYIHLLGDMQEDSKRKERDQIIPLIEKHGMSEIFVYKPNRDIFTELYHYLPILFENNVNLTYRSYYTSMIREIKNTYSDAKKEMKNNSEEEKREYNNNLTPGQLNKYSERLLNILQKYMPTLLEHTAFSGIFY